MHWENFKNTAVRNDYGTTVQNNEPQFQRGDYAWLMISSKPGNTSARVVPWSNNGQVIATSTSQIILSTTSNIHLYFITKCKLA